MKALPFKIPHGSKESIKVDYEKLPHFYNAYHLHEELQLMLIISGHGTAYIGDKIVQFKEDDVYLLGQSLPHVFKDKSTDSASEIAYISIFFTPDFMGAGFLSLPESRLLSTLLSESVRGIMLEAELKEIITKKVWQVYERSGMERLLALAETLELIAVSQDLNFISSPGYHKPKRLVDGQKINDVFDFMMANFSKEIRLAEIADIAHMSATAFCRYFKHHTRKTYSRFLNEIRVGHACKLLLEDKLSVSEISVDSGFKNISNFNRQFKKITNLTPSDYQKQNR